MTFVFALIPLSNLKDAIDIILKLNFDLNDKHLEFIEYFFSQWFTAKQSKSKQCPDIYGIDTKLVLEQIMLQKLIIQLLKIVYLKHIHIVIKL